MMSTCCSKRVEAWNKYIKKECVKLVINQNQKKILNFKLDLLQIIKSKGKRRRERAAEKCRVGGWGELENNGKNIS
jgi:hypothetical protein